MPSTRGVRVGHDVIERNARQRGSWHNQTRPPPQKNPKNNNNTTTPTKGKKKGKGKGKEREKEETEKEKGQRNEREKVGSSGVRGGVVGEERALYQVLVDVGLQQLARGPAATDIRQDQ